MMFRNVSLILSMCLFANTSDAAFIRPSASTTSMNQLLSRRFMAVEMPEEVDDTLVDISLLYDESNYKPGGADTELAKRFGSLAGKPLKTVGEAFADFSKFLGVSVNAVYKNIISDVVATTHLDVVDARFKRDPIWSSGIIGFLDILLKNYPEPEVVDSIYEALFKAIDMDLKEVRAEAQQVKDWATGKSREEIEDALAGKTDCFVAKVSDDIRSEEYWKYSRYFALGLMFLMEGVGIEDIDIYDPMQDWLSNKLGGKDYQIAFRDVDIYRRAKRKIVMMETMMKEIEIREKKRQADRLEQKAEAALKAAKEASSEETPAATKSEDTKAEESTKA